MPPSRSQYSRPSASGMRAPLPLRGRNDRQDAVRYERLDERRIAARDAAGMTEVNAIDRRMRFSGKRRCVASADSGSADADGGQLGDEHLVHGTGQRGYDDVERLVVG